MGSVAWLSILMPSITTRCSAVVTVHEASASQALERVAHRRGREPQPRPRRRRRLRGVRQQPVCDGDARPSPDRIIGYLSGSDGGRDVGVDQDAGSADPKAPATVEPSPASVAEPILGVGSDSIRDEDRHVSRTSWLGHGVLGARCGAVATGTTSSSKRTSSRTAARVRPMTRGVAPRGRAVRASRTCRSTRGHR
jgi:hypothetical protein